MSRTPCSARGGGSANFVPCARALHPVGGLSETCRMARPSARAHANVHAAAPPRCHRARGNLPYERVCHVRGSHVPERCACIMDANGTRCSQQARNGSTRTAAVSHPQRDPAHRCRRRSTILGASRHTESTSRYADCSKALQWRPPAGTRRAPHDEVQSHSVSHSVAARPSCVRAAVQGDRRSQRGRSSPVGRGGGHSAPLVPSGRVMMAASQPSASLR